MSEEYSLEIVNPEKSFLSKNDVTEVVVPAFEGEIGILKDHISIISFLKPGIMKIYSKFGINEFIICCGYKGEIIKRYFADYYLNNSDIEFDLAKNNYKTIKKAKEDYQKCILDNLIKRQDELELREYLNKSKRKSYYNYNYNDDDENDYSEISSDEFLYSDSDMEE